MKRIKLLGWANGTDWYYGPQAEFDQKHIDLIKKDIIKNGYVIHGNTHQFEALPVFPDGIFAVSKKAWAKIMAEAMNENIGQEKFSYRNFYDSNESEFEENLPEAAYFTFGNEIEKME